MQKKLQSVLESSDEYFNKIRNARDFNQYSGERAAINQLKRHRNCSDLNFEEPTVSFLEGYKAYLK